MSDLTAPLCLARPPAAQSDPVPPGKVVGRMLRTQIALATSSEMCVLQALHTLRRGFRLSFGAAYLVLPPRPDYLTLYATENLPPEFDQVALRIPLPDYADIADLPYNGTHRGCWGDFFAPVAASYAMHAWMFLSIIPPGTSQVQAALLLGCRDPSRLNSVDTAPLLMLAEIVSEKFAAFALPK